MGISHRPSWPSVVVVSALTLVLLPGETRAHHEAIFGPQSSILVSEESFASFQVFSKRLEGEGAGAQDTTGLISAGISPFHSLPLSFVATMPANHTTAGHAHLHLDDLIVGARLTLDLNEASQALGGNSGMLLVSAAAELPTGTGHPEFGRNVSAMPGLMGVFERGRMSIALFGFAVLNGSDSAGRRPGHELFAGGGLGYGLHRSEAFGLTAQLGLAYEHQVRDQGVGEAAERTGGRRLMLSPTVAANLGHHWQLFTMISLPAWQRWRDSSNAEQWRLGAGVIYAFGQSHEHAH